jgi:hypothetical protein
MLLVRFEFAVPVPDLLISRSRLKVGERLSDHKRTAA